ncbi:MAG: CPBP family intramembrane metalloprotease [Oscillospiraceae bacterium]|nr:CPBP family intramembrane metalloprotease [Oscillospiraceae bacterium]
MENVENVEQVTQEQPTLRGYKIVCAKLGFVMCVYFICRFLAGAASSLLERYSGSLSEPLHAALSLVILTLLVYVAPIVFTVLIFKYDTPFRVLYKKPKRLARALGTFPATFGLGHGVALLTLLVSYLLSRVLGGESLIEQLLRPTTVEATTSISQIVIMVILMVVAAPLFEEYWVRGIMFDALKPYGTGMAIIISSLLFGIMHGSLYMLFYTTAYGLALGYIRYATGSLFIVTILHAIVNSIGASTLLLLSLQELTNEENRVINTIFTIFMVAVFVMIIIGIVVFLSKIPTIRRYKFENNWTQIGPWKKFGVFLISIPVVIMMLLAINEITQYRIVDLIFS